MSEPLGLNTVIGCVVCFSFHHSHLAPDSLESYVCLRFGGNVENGLIAHPDGKTLIYPLGSTIVLRDKKDPKAQEFLQGHSDKVRPL
jgi:hypothetical protein